MKARVVLMASFTTLLLGLFIVFLPGDHRVFAREGTSPPASWLVKTAPGVMLSDARHLFGDWWEVSQSAAYSPLALRPDVIKVMPNRTFRLTDPSPVFVGESEPQASPFPNDPYYPYQWHLPLVQADDVWTTTLGVSVTVAIIDTGVSLDGEDLDCHAFVHPYNAVTGEEGVAAAADDYGHGTHVAGTVAQCTNNGKGVAGMATEADLMPVRVLVNGEGKESDLAVGIMWTVDHGADIINLSLGAKCEEGDVWPECASDIVDEAIQHAVDNDVIIVAAAGNDGEETLVYPANHPDVIAVSAVGADKQRASYSNYRQGVTLAAPGGDFWDANQDGYLDGVLQETFGYNGWGYYFMLGTSMATPHVSGALALLKSAFPDVSPERLVDALELTAEDLGAPGYDEEFGYGLIQVKDALAFLEAGQTLTDTLFMPLLTYESDDRENGH